MPGFDRTGPMGAGPMTGGGRGVCRTTGTGFSGGRGYGYGSGSGFGRGMGLRCGFGRNPVWNQPAYAGNPADELNVLRAEVGSAKNILDAINRRISELEKS